MTDFTMRLFTLPILTNLIVATASTAAIAYYYYRPDVKKMWTNAIKDQAEDRNKVFKHGDNTLQQGLKTGNVGQVSTGASVKLTAAQSFGPAYAAGKFIETGLKGLFK